MSFEVTLKGDQTLDSVDIDIMLYIRSWCRDVYKAQTGHSYQIVL